MWSMRLQMMDTACTHYACADTIGTFYNDKNKVCLVVHSLMLRVSHHTIPVIRNYDANKYVLLSTIMCKHMNFPGSGKQGKTERNASCKHTFIRMSKFPCQPTCRRVLPPGEIRGTIPPSCSSVASRLKVFITANI